MRQERSREIEMITVIMNQISRVLSIIIFKQQIERKVVIFICNKEQNQKIIFKKNIFTFD